MHHRNSSQILEIKAQLRARSSVVSRVRVHPRGLFEALSDDERVVSIILSRNGKDVVPKVCCGRQPESVGRFLNRFYIELWPAFGSNGEIVRDLVVYRCVWITAHWAVEVIHPLVCSI